MAFEQRLSYRFDDPHGFIETLGGWDGELVPLSPGSHHVSWEGVITTDFTISTFCHTGRSHDRFAISQGLVAFALSLNPGANYCGLALPAGTLAIIGSGREHRFTKTDYQGVELLFGEGVVRAHPVLGHLLAVGFGPDELVFPLAPRQTAALLQAAETVLNHHSALQATLGAEAVRDRFLDLVGEAIGSCLGDGLAPKPQRVPRYDLARQALDLVDEVGGDMSVSDVAASLGVTRRTLELSFRSALGMSPGQYLLARKLSHSRRLLLENRSNVTTIATSCGFNDLSRFAYQYARLYGEPPSKTLIRARSRQET